MQRKCAEMVEITEMFHLQDRIYIRKTKSRKGLYTVLR